MHHHLQRSEAMTGGGGGQKVSIWVRPAANLHFLKPFFNFNPQLQSQPQPISIPHQFQNPPFLPNLVQFLTSIIPFKRPPAAKPQPPPRSTPQIPSFRYESGCAVPLFRPYVAKVPWHGGVRAFLSQLFPRYGHYCGPNWSSGKDGGSMLWDRRPIDWLDFCCYCHDIGYDSEDQAKLLKADLAFLECLERPRMATKGGAHRALLYRSMCITGLRHILIPYRMQLVRMQSGPSFMEVLSSLFVRRGNAYRQNSE